MTDSLLSRAHAGAQLRRGLLVPLAAVTVCAGLLTGAGPAAALPSPAGAGLRVHWGRALEVPGLAALNAGGEAQVTSVSCASAGNCGAGGFYTRTRGYREAFVLSERDGRWGKAAEVRGSAALNAGGDAQVTSVSCPSAGDCAAGGYYTGHGRHTQGFVVTERGGRWGAALEVPGLTALNTGNNAQVTSVSCPSVGNCAAGGSYQTDTLDGDDSYPVEAFVVSQARGRWRTAQEVPGMAMLNGGWNASVVSLSCSSAGNCGAGGYLQFVQFIGCDALAARVSGGRSAGPAQPPEDCEASFVVGQKNGHWGTALGPPDRMSQVNSVSCRSAGNCTAAGFSGFSPAQNQAYVMTERDGRWGETLQVPGTTRLSVGGPAQVNSVSCWSAGNCGADGSYTDKRGHGQVFVVSERNSRWARAEEMPGTAALNLGGNAQVTSMSCGSPRNCAAGGSYTDPGGRTQAFVSGSK